MDQDRLESLPLDVLIDLELEQARKVNPNLTEREEQYLIDKVYSKKLQLQSKESMDAKDFGPYWLEGIQGSLAEERRQSSPDKTKAYNHQVAKARRILRRESFSFLDYLSNPDQLTIKLSLFWSLYPSLEIFYKIDVSDITKRSSKLLRAFIIWFYRNIESFPSKFIIFEVEAELDRILNEDDTCPISPQLLAEMKAIRQIFLVLGSIEGYNLLKEIYSEENLSRWINTTKDILSKYLNFIRIPYARIERKVYRRGYKESHSNKHKSKDQRGEVAMSTEARTLEEIKQSILRKQALLFEKRLDDFLSIRSEEVPTDQKKQIFKNIIEESIPRKVDSEEILETLWNPDDDQE